MFVRDDKFCTHHHLGQRPIIPTGSHFCPYCRRHRFLHLKPWELLISIPAISLSILVLLMLFNFQVNATLKTTQVLPIVTSHSGNLPASLSVVSTQIAMSGMQSLVSTATLEPLATKTERPIATYLSPTQVPKSFSVITNPQGAIPIRPQPTNTFPSTCAGIGTAFSVGDIVVSDSDGLRILKRYQGGAMSAVAQANKGNQLEILQGPVCASSSQYHQQVWYWYVSMMKNGRTYNGWVAEGIKGNKFLCSLSYPDC